MDYLSIFKSNQIKNPKIKQMKKTIILISMIAISSVSWAQKGSWYLGGLAGLSSSTSKDASSGAKNVLTDWTFSPEFGTFLRDDIQLGIAMGFSGGSKNNDGSRVSQYSVINPTVYCRKFFKITDNFSTFAGLYVNHTSGKLTEDVTPTEIITKQSGFAARIGVGVAYALSPRFTAVGQYGLFGFQSLKNKTDDMETSTDTSFDFGVNTVGGSTLSQGNGSGSVFNIGLYYTIFK